MQRLRRVPGRLMVLGFILSIVAVLPGCGQVGGSHVRSAAPATQLASHGGQESVALAWNIAAVEAARKSSIPGPAIARALSIIHTSIYDAWAAYDAKAVGTRLGATLRRPAGERTLANQEKAISFAAYRAAVDLFPDSQPAFDALMSKLGYDPKDTSTNKASPSGIGNVVSKAVLDFRHGDGANQLGDAPGGKGPYTDYTGYKPVNSPMDMRLPFDPATVKDVGHWQPLTYVDAKGAVVTSEFVTPHWGKVAPFAMTSGSQLRAPGPAQPGTERFKAQAQEVLDYSANLTEQQKVIVHYWAEEPPPPQWNEFAQFVSRRDRHGTDAAGTERDGLWPPVVPSVVLVESLSGRRRTDAPVNRFLKTCDVVEVVPSHLARRAAALRAKARQGSAVDAIVVATAEPAGTVLGGDLGDLRALATYADGVIVLRV